MPNYCNACVNEFMCIFVRFQVMGASGNICCVGLCFIYDRSAKYIHFME